MRFCGRINSPQNSGHTHYLEQPKAIGKLLQCNARTLVGTFYNVLCTLKSDARFLKIVRLILAVYVCPWDCCSTCLMQFYNLSLSLKDLSVSVSMLCHKYILDTGLFSPLAIFASTSTVLSRLEFAPTMLWWERERYYETLEFAKS